MKRVNFIVLSALAFSWAVLAPPLPAEFVYVANIVANNISGYSLDPANGALTPMVAAFPTGKQPIGIAIDPTSRFCYVVNSGDNTVSGYDIAKKTGALTAIPGSPFVTGAVPFAVAVDPLSRFVFVVNVSSESVSAYKIDAQNGALTQVTGSPFQTPAGAESISVTRRPSSSTRQPARTPF